MYTLGWYAYIRHCTQNAHETIQYTHTYTTLLFPTKRNLNEKKNNKRHGTRYVRRKSFYYVECKKEGEMLQISRFYFLFSKKAKNLIAISIENCMLKQWDRCNFLHNIICNANLNCTVNFMRLLFSKRPNEVFQIACCLIRSFCHCYDEENNKNIGGGGGGGESARFHMPYYHIFTCRLHKSNGIKQYTTI